jgi:hypothetical protein
MKIGLRERLRNWRRWAMAHDIPPIVSLNAPLPGIPEETVEADVDTALLLTAHETRTNVRHLSVFGDEEDDEDGTIVVWYVATIATPEGVLFRYHGRTSATWREWTFAQEELDLWCWGCVWSDVGDFRRAASGALSRRERKAKSDVQGRPGSSPGKGTRCRARELAVATEPKTDRRNHEAADVRSTGNSWLGG